MLPLSIFHDGCKDQERGSFGHLKDLLYHGGGIAAPHFLATVVTILDTYTRVQNTEIIEYFCDGTNRRAWVFARGFLLTRGDATPAAATSY